MIKRLYVHNFRCLENFELVLGDKRSALLIGDNGSGKSTVSFALELLQAIGRGTNRVGKLVKPVDLARHQVDVPIRFEVDVELGGQLYQFRLALELPEHFKELRVQSEQLMVDGQSIYTREQSKVRVKKQAEFGIDWHLIALTIIQERSGGDPLFIFKQWLARMIILSPIPSLIHGESAEETLEPLRQAQNLGGWFAGMIAHSPAVYSAIEAYLRSVWPDFEQVQNPIVGAETRSLTVQFRSDKSRLSLPFNVLSDGEKCFFIAALVLAANTYGPVFCFWDEPDSYLSMDEVAHFITALRATFERGGQILMTSHNAETIRRFSEDTTLVLYRRSHLEPTRVKLLDDVDMTDDLITTLMLGELKP